MCMYAINFETVYQIGAILLEMSLLNVLHSHHVRRHWFYVKNHFRNFHRIFTF